jgi:plastocyanin
MSTCPRLARIAFITLAAADLAACADDEQPGVIDAPTIDAPQVVDAPVTDAPQVVDAPTIDAPTDAPPPIDAPSSVQIISCTGANPIITINAGTFAFVPATPTITVNQVVEFIPGGPHSMTSGAPANSPDGLFATTIGQTACLRFTAAGTFPFYCNPHLFTGTITVN